MTHRRLARGSVLAVLLVFAAAGCTSPVPPTVPRQPPRALERNAQVFLYASQMGGQILKSLRAAGVNASMDYESPTYQLQVEIGKNRRTTPCGGTSNVAYILLDQGVQVLVIKGRGKTGTCPDNIIDAMSQELARFIGP